MVNQAGSNPVTACVQGRRCPSFETIPHSSFIYYLIHLNHSSIWWWVGGLEPPTSPLSGCALTTCFTKGITVLLDIVYNISINLCGHLLSLVFGKEVIQPQVPLRLPCYDFTPVMNHTVVNAPRRLSYLLLVQPTPMV